MSRLKKILYIHHGQGLGGAPKSMAYLIDQLDRRRYEPKVLCLYDSDVVPFLRAHGVEVRVEPKFSWGHFPHSELVWIPWHRPDRLLRASYAWCRTAWDYGRRVLREERPDLVHLNGISLSAWAIAAHSLGIPVIDHLREPLHGGYLGVRRHLVRAVYAHAADRLIGINELHARRMGLPGKTDVIYNFVDFAHYDRSLLPAPEITACLPPGKRVLFLGGASTTKGFEVLVDALPRLDPGITVLFAGDYGASTGPHFATRRDSVLGRALAEMRAAPNVVEIGVQTDIAPWIAVSDLVVFPSTVPHFGRPIVEAGAMAKPVVASQLEGTEELVVDRRTGLLVPAKDPAALAAGINEICRNSEWAAGLGEAGYQRARRLFDAQRNAQATFAVYDRLLARSA